MTKIKNYNELGFRIEFNDEAGSYKVSWDSGKTWIKNRQIYNDKNIIEGNEVGNWYVRNILKPELQPGESLCQLCCNRGLVGIVKYAGRVTGREARTVVKYEEDYEYTEDEYFGVAYDQWKCTRCGDLADSEYA